MNQHFFDQSFLPYSVALLQAHVLAHSSQPSRYLFLLPIFECESVASACDKLMAADVVGMSVYVWNIQRSLALAAALKRRKPQIRIFFGGPQVPDQAEAFLRAHPQVDLCFHGPGEDSFLSCLEQYPVFAPETLKGVSWLDATGQFHTRPQAPWQRDLTQAASPYLLGCLDPLLALYPGRSWIAPWETNRGCPFSCTFCDWGSATSSKVLRFPMERLEAEIHWFASRRITSIFCCDANFGLLPRDELITETLIQVYRQTGFPREIYTQSAKNATERVYRIQKRLAEAGLSRGVTLSFQTLDAQALRDIQRENISLASYRELQYRFRCEGIPTYTDLLIGVPGETLASFAAGLEAVIRGGQHEQLRFYEIALLPNAPMAQPEYRRKYQLQTIQVPAVTPWGAVETRADPLESYEILIGSYSYSVFDWQQMRIFAWLTELFYFYHQALQLPILLLMQLEQLSLIELLESWLKLPKAEFPLCYEIKTFLQHRAAGIVAGEPLLSAGPEWPGKPRKIWLSAVNFIYCGLIESQLLDRFFAECTAWLLRVHPGIHLPTEALVQSVAWCCEAFKATYHLPVRAIALDWNLLECWQALQQGELFPLKRLDVLSQKQREEKGDTEYGRENTHGDFLRR